MSLETIELTECTHCAVAQPPSEFSIKDHRTGRRNRKCKACQRITAKDNYQANVERYLTKAAIHNEDYRVRNHALVQSVLDESFCACCKSENDLLHYLPGASGEQLVRHAVHSGLGVEAVSAAMARSIVLCNRCAPTHIQLYVVKGEKTRASPGKPSLRNYRRKSPMPGILDLVQDDGITLAEANSMLAAEFACASHIQ